jgi:hypothetical protein
MRNHQSLAEVLKLNKEKRMRRMAEMKLMNAQEDDMETQRIKPPVILEHIAATRAE